MKRAGADGHIQGLHDGAPLLGPELLKPEDELLEIHANCPVFERGV
tara:strand:- start:373 stop:510 length:138 start_codon:yes stop_codon:yes gene_type:complete